MTSLCRKLLTKNKIGVCELVLTYYHYTYIGPINMMYGNFLLKT